MEKHELANWYPPFEAVGDTVITNFLAYAIHYKKNFSDAKRKKLLAKLDEYDILKFKGSYKARRRKLERFIEYLGGQKTFEAYLKRRRRKYGTTNRSR